MIEVAIGEHGQESMDKLTQTHQSQFEAIWMNLTNDSSSIRRPISDIRVTSERHPISTHVWTHTQRALLMTLRDPLVFGMRFTSSFVVAAFVGLMFGPVGHRGGCPPAIDGDFEPSDLDNATEHIKAELEDTYNNNGLQFFSILFMLFNALMPTCMAFPGEMHVFIKVIVVKSRDNYHIILCIRSETMVGTEFQLIT